MHNVTDQICILFSTINWFDISVLIIVYIQSVNCYDYFCNHSHIFYALFIQIFYFFIFFLWKQVFFFFFCSGFFLKYLCNTYSCLMVWQELWFFLENKIPETKWALSSIMATSLWETTVQSSPLRIAEDSELILSH